MYKKSFLIALALLSGLSGQYCFAQELWGIWGKLRGTVYKIDSVGNNYHDIYDFLYQDSGSVNGTMVEYQPGKLLGVAQGTGMNGKGLIYEYDYVNKTYVDKYEFDSIKGSSPNVIIKTQSGNFYGIAGRGGSKNLGTIFQYDPANNTVNKLYDFDTSIVYTAFPRELMEGTDGKLYGICSGWNNSPIFRYDPVTGIFTKLIEIPGADGSPMKLVQTSNGLLYGVAINGGAHTYGDLFSYNPLTNIYTKLYDFNGTPDGANPNGLILASDGYLYGTANTGGTTNNYGTLFKYNINTNSLTTVVQFNGLGVANPIGTIIETANHKLYGGTTKVFEYDLATSVHSFLGPITPQCSNARVMQASDGNIYAVGEDNSNYKFCVFKIDTTTNSLTEQYCNPTSTCACPNNELTQAANGKLYGITSGGPLGHAQIFEMDPVLHNFSTKIWLNDSTGNQFGNSRYNEKMVLGANGKLYGITLNKGAFNMGTFFEYDPSLNIYKKIVDLNGNNGNGNNGFAITTCTNGKIYFVTSNGGSKNFGVLCEYDPSTSFFLKRIDFDSLVTGILPQNSLISYNGKIYGITISFASRKGRIFEYDPTSNSINCKINMDSIPSARPYLINLTLHSSGIMYGIAQGSNVTTSSGGLFKYDAILNNITFPVLKGGLLYTLPSNLFDTRNALTESSDGNLYGVSSDYVYNYNYYIFKLNVSNDSIETKDYWAGTSDTYGGLTYVDKNISVSVKEIFSGDKEVRAYPNPFQTSVTIELNNGRTEQRAQLLVFDIFGREVGKQEISANKVVFQRNELKNGIYFYRIITSSEKNYATGKLIIE
ncbi:MAG: choice-of-anchor tandem repeat GloVer-containing protein [Bacteroidia bacterium]